MFFQTKAKIKYVEIWPFCSKVSVEPLMLGACITRAIVRHAACVLCFARVCIKFINNKIVRNANTNFTRISRLSF